jgi:hypothetical protein
VDEDQDQEGSCVEVEFWEDVELEEYRKVKKDCSHSYCFLTIRTRNRRSKRSLPGTRQRQQRSPFHRRDKNRVKKFKKQIYNQGDHFDLWQHWHGLEWENWLYGVPCSDYGKKFVS